MLNPGSHKTITFCSLAIRLFYVNAAQELKLIKGNCKGQSEYLANTQSTAIRKVRAN